MFLNVSQLQLRTGTKRKSYSNIDQFHFNRDGPLIFWLEEGGGEKFWNKLFAEVVNTEINCMQVKKMFACQNFPTLPVKKITVCPL